MPYLRRNNRMLLTKEKGRKKREKSKGVSAPPFVGLVLNIGKFRATVYVRKNMYTMQI